MPIWRSTSARVPALIATLAMTLSLSACSSDPTKGYSTASTYDQSVRSIAVPMFDNTTFNIGQEAYLTEAIIKELRTSTPWIVTSPGNAETTLSGSIVRSDLIPYSRESEIGLVQEVGVRFTVDFEWVDNRTGKTLVARRNYSAAESFVPSLPSGERLAVGEQATIQELARDIVSELRSNW